MMTFTEGLSLHYLSVKISICFSNLSLVWCFELIPNHGEDVHWVWTTDKSKGNMKLRIEAILVILLTDLGDIATAIRDGSTYRYNSFLVFGVSLVCAVCVVGAMVYYRRRNTPLPPANLKAANQTDSSLVVTWKAPECEYECFIIEIEPLSTSTVRQKIIQKESALEATFSGLAPGMTYIIAARTICGRLESEITEGTFMTRPLPPANLKAANQTDSSLIIKWKAPECEYECFIIAIGSTTTFAEKQKVVQTVSALEATFSDLAPSMTYVIAARTKCGGLESVITEETFMTRPLPPANLKAANQTDSALVVTWKAPKCEYECFIIEIEPLTTSAEKQIIVQKESALEATFSGLAPGMTYVIAARTICGRLESVITKETFMSTWPSHDIMISYCWDQQALVKRIYNELTQAGYHVWIDTEHLRGDVYEGLAAAVDGAKIVLCCISKNYEMSANCKKEAKYAAGHHDNKLLIPVVVEPCYKPSGWLKLILENHLWYDFTQEEDITAKMVELKKRISDCKENLKEELSVQKVSPVPRANKIEEDELRTDLGKEGMQQGCQKKEKPDLPVQVVSPVPRAKKMEDDELKTDREKEGLQKGCQKKEKPDDKGADISMERYIESSLLKKAVYNAGPVTIHLMGHGEELREELKEIVILACAIASSERKGSIKLHNEDYDGRNVSGMKQHVTTQHLKKWKGKVESVLKCKIQYGLENDPSQLFEFSENKETDPYIYLYIRPAMWMLSLDLPLQLGTDEETANPPQQRLTYSFVLDKKDKSILLPRPLENIRRQKIEQFKKDQKITHADPDSAKLKKVKTLQFKSFYGIEGLADIQGSMFCHSTEQSWVWPHNYRDYLTKAGEEICEPITTFVCGHLKKTGGFIYVSPCMRLDLKGDKIQDKHFICDILVLTSDKLPLLLTVCVDSTETIRTYSLETSLLLDQCLSMFGESSFCVNRAVITKTPPKGFTRNREVNDLLTGLSSQQVATVHDFPKSYCTMNQQKLDKIVESLIICLASFSPTAYVQDIASSYMMHLLTYQQLAALQKCKITSDGMCTVIRGLPGTGKTVVAIEWMRWKRRMGVTKQEMLYVVYSHELAERVGKMKMSGYAGEDHEYVCRAVSLCELLSVRGSNTDYTNVKYLVLDDIQNFEAVDKKNVLDVKESMDTNTMEVSTAATEKHDSLESQIKTNLSEQDTSANTSVRNQTHENMAVDFRVTNQSTYSIEQANYEAHNPKDHWLDKFTTRFGNLEDKHIIMLYDPNQMIRDTPDDKLNNYLNGKNEIKLEQICRNSVKIAQFIYSELVPRDEPLFDNNIQSKMAHNYKGEVECLNIDVSEDTLSKILHTKIDSLTKTDNFTEDDIGIVIDESVTSGHVKETAVPLAQPNAAQTDCQDAKSQGTKDREHQTAIGWTATPTTPTEPGQSYPTLTGDSQESIAQGSPYEREQSSLNVKWSLLDESVGIEKPVIVAVLLKSAPWRRKLAIASRARVKLVWITLKQPISSTDLMHKLMADRKGQLYTLWFTSKPAIAVFAGEIYGKGHLERVIAAPLAPHGLAGGYAQVEAIPRIPHPRWEAAVVRYQGEVWLVGGSDIDGKDLGGCDVLDLAAWTWRQGPPLRTPRHQHTVTEVSGVLVTVGGTVAGDNHLSSVETMESGSAWRPGPELPGGRGDHAACEWNERVWVSGGIGDGEVDLESVMSWGPGEADWRHEQSLDERRSHHTMAGIGRDRLLVCGGLNTNSVLEYSVQSRAWSRLTDLPEQKWQSSLVVYGKAGYIVGGDGSTSTWRYDGTWHEEEHSLPWEMDDTVACIIDLPYSQ